MKASIMGDLSINQVEKHPLMVFAGGGSRARRSRLNRFCEWQLQTRDPWYLPDLASWRDHLMVEEATTTTTARAYLSTVRSAYRKVLRDNQVRQLLYQQLDDEMPPERKYALISEFFTQLKNALDPDNAPVSTITVQDEDDRDHYWLTPSQVAMLIQAPGLDTWLGLRDTALIALMLCTGIRAAEAVAVDVDDLRARLGNTLALRIKAGKGLKQRLIPYGAQDWALTLVDAWLDTIQQDTGPVFVGLRKGDHLYLDENGEVQRLAVNAVGTCLRRYPLSIDGHLVTIQPHDLRRTYARRLYLVGTDLTAIQQNLGHDNQQTTLDYIGSLDADYRAPDDAYGTVWLQPLWEALANRRKQPPSSIKTEIQVGAGFPQDALWLADDEISRGQALLVENVQGFVFKVWLDGISPQIWRRFQVPAGISFETLHDIVQIVMGWEHYHLFRFAVGDLGFMRDPMGHGDHDANTSIDTYLKHPNSVLYYEYDFGDSWRHVLQIEEQLSQAVDLPACLDGRNACPPEDSGGPMLYAQFLDARKNRRGPVSRKWQHRIGTYWDANLFSKQTINTELKRYWQQQAP
jgi:site-specific recombinase XerD